MNCPFKVGDQVLCIERDTGHHLVVGNVYTIREPCIDQDQRDFNFHGYRVYIEGIEDYSIKASRFISLKDIPKEDAHTAVNLLNV